VTPSNIHEDLARADEIVGPSDRRFGLTIAAVCAVIAGVRFVLGHPYAGWWLAAALILSALAVFWTAPLQPLNRLWLRLGLLLYRVVNPMVMALLFYSTMVPIGLLMRLCGKDPLRLRREPETPSYWLMREPSGPPRETMRNQF
jgi:Saxitoxin biosynthesis operon protein SxtJ